MRPLEPDPGREPFVNPAGNPAFDIEKTFGHLAAARHAPDDFHAQVMAQAADLPEPNRQAGKRFGVDWPSPWRLPRPATVALVSVLLLCMAALGYLYLHIAQLQVIAKQEQQRLVEVATLERQPRPVESLSQGELVALTEVALEVPQSPAEGDGTWPTENPLIGLNEMPESREPSILTDIFEGLQRVFEAIWDTGESTQ